MLFEIINALCWISVFFCFYLILNPNINIMKNLHISPYKIKLNKEREPNYNVIEHLQNFPQEKLIKISKSFTNNFDVMVFNFNGSLNIGNIMRLSCIYGADNYYIVGRKIYDSRSCVGSNKYLNVKILQNIVKYLPDKNIDPDINKKELKQFFINNNLSPIFIEQGGEDITKFNFKSNIPKINNKPVFIFGNESYGIDKEVLNYCSDIEGFSVLSIPQLGILRSLNVSNSASIVLWEYYKQILVKSDPKYKYDL